MSTIPPSPSPRAAKSGKKRPLRRRAGHPARHRPRHLSLRPLPRTRPPAARLSAPGLGPTQIDKIIGVTKSYTTRVGAGAFPTELEDETGSLIRERGHEYGTTTGRPRRCGWLDGVALRYSVLVNGLSAVSLMHLDVLSGFPEVKICTRYQTEDGQIIEDFPSDQFRLVKCKPVYETVPRLERGCQRRAILRRASREYEKSLSLRWSRSPDARWKSSASAARRDQDAVPDNRVAIALPEKMGCLMQIRLRYAAVACSMAFELSLAASLHPHRHWRWPRPSSVSSEAAHVYHGAWFDIACPQGFRVKSGPLSTSSTTGSDSAYFTSPDGAAQFFVFSPQWSGNCPYAQIDAKTGKRWFQPGNRSPLRGSRARLQPMRCM